MLQRWSSCALLLMRDSLPSLSVVRYSDSTLAHPIATTGPSLQDSTSISADSSSIQKASLIGPIELAVSASTKAQVADFPDPPPPELCCGSGCPNCKPYCIEYSPQKWHFQPAGIWIQYADDVMAYVKSLPLHDGVVEKQRKMVREALKKNIEDDNLRMYILMEVQAKGF